MQKWLESEDLVDSRLLALVKGLRGNGWRCALGTNQESHRARYIRRNMKFEDLFDLLLISAEIGSMKPSKEFFVRGTEMLGCAAGEVLFIDNEEKYVEAAAACGWNTILYEDFSSLQNCQEDFYFQWNKSLLPS